MNFRLRLNLIPILVVMAGISVAGYVAYTWLQNNARAEILRNAGLMLDTASAIRNYTISQVKPHLELQLMRVFLPQSVPAYAATETLGALKDKYPDYTYKEATLNPTNPRDKAVEWEADLVQAFRKSPGLAEISGERDTPAGRSLYLARPIKIKDESCLACHTTASSAPKAMVALYGEANGFGWKLNDIIGAQIMSVPMSLPIRIAEEAFFSFIAWLAGIFLLLLVVLNITLNRAVLKPINDISRLADRVSTGDFDVPEFPDSTKGPLLSLTRSFNRMRRSLVKAMRMLEQ
jgi:HAMP domain-containing protein